MSLINDALKKAQRQRAEGSTPATDLSTPAASSEPLQRVARRGKPAAFRTQVLLIAGGAVAVVALLAVGAIFFFRSPAEPTEKAKPTQIATTPAPAQTPPAAATPVPAPVATTPTPAAPSPSVPAVAKPVPVEPNPAPVSAPVAATPPAAPTSSAPASTQFVLPPPAAAPEVAATSPAPTATPASAERPKASARMIGVIEHFRVGGIRVSGTESKVLMNDKVYRLNDIVDHELGIRLTGIETKALTFEDARGAVHTRNF